MGTDIFCFVLTSFYCLPGVRSDVRICGVILLVG